MKKTVSVLGCGWLGKPLAVFLNKEDFLVKGSTTSSTKIIELQELKIQSFLVDISLDQDVTDFLNSDILIIAITHKNIDNFKKLIGKIEQSTIQKVLFVSTTSVYPRINKIMTEESETTETPHLKIEELFRENLKFKTTIIRFSGLFGGARKPSNWFKKGRKIPQPEGFVNLIHLQDCIGIINAIINQNCWGETFNASCNHHPKRREFYTKVKQDAGFEVPVFEENSPLAWKIISSEKVQKKLKYRFKIDNLFKI